MFKNKFENLMTRISHYREKKKYAREPSKNLKIKTMIIERGGDDARGGLHREEAVE